MRLLFFFLIVSAASFSQVGIGQWRFHMPGKQAIDVVALNDRVFVAFPTGLGELEYSTNEVSTWTAVNSLSDISISCLGYSQSTNALFIGYENGNIDKIKSNNITNIPAIKLAQVQGLKKINKIVEHDGFMYFATGFSIVKIDPNKNEVKDTYYPTNGNESILDLAFKGDSIFALTSNKMFSGSILNLALADPAQWVIDLRVPVLSAPTSNYSEVEIINDSMFVLLKIDGYGLDTLYKMQNNLLIPKLESFTVEVNSIERLDNKLVVNYFPGTLIYDLGLTSFDWLGGYSFGGGTNANSIVYKNGYYWIADENVGLVKHNVGGPSTGIIFEGPPNSAFYNMSWAGGKLAVASGGLSGISSTYNRSGIYVFEEEKWILKNQENQVKWNNANIWDYLTCSINPTNNNQIAVGTYSEVPVSLLNINGSVTDTFSVENSLIEGVNPASNNSLISSVKYDENGNLWVLNGYCSKPLKVYTKEGSWHQFSSNNTDNNVLTFKLEIDYKGNKWYSARNSGLFGYNDNGTISNLSDDKSIHLTTGQFSGALPSNLVSAIAVDFDNEIWIGTDNGFAVLYNSEAAFDAVSGEYNAQRIKVEFEGNVEYVLGNTSITDIIVDGANRKWFATESNGIILLSQDGLEVLEHHTKENSPLVSNTILDLEMNHNTGELYIITNKGLVSYRTDATYEDPEYSNVTVFPNPARPEFDGPITIQGIRYNSDIKITDIAGKLVFQTTSNGGTATWDGKTVNGEGVPSGVYLIWSAANEGKGRKVGKVLVVN